MMQSDISTRWQPLSDWHAIAEDWQQLEAQADCSVFLSWQWIGTWLKTWPAERCLLRLHASSEQGAELVGLAIISPGFERRHGFVAARQWRLHQSGVASQDQIWIEYNAVLAKQGWEVKVQQAAQDFVLQQPGWDELILAGIAQQQAQSWQQSGLTAVVDWQAPCFGVDLQQLRAQGGDYLASLSANCRYQINRSKKRYQQRGALRLAKPQDLAEAQAWFAAMGPWHQQRFGTGPGQSGFSNPDFIGFHQAMLADYWPQQGVELLALMAGDEHLATFYQLCYRQHVYFYLAGFKPEQDKHLKPGLVGHSLCIEHYSAEGLDFYDFMAGDERYKRQLGFEHNSLCQLRLQRPRLDLRLEAAAKAGKQRLSRLLGVGKRQ